MIAVSMKIFIIDQSSCKGLLGDDVVKLFLRHKAVVIGIGSLDHFLELRFIDCFSQFLRHSSQVLDRDEAGLLIVEQVEYLPDVLTGVFV